eukprot:403336172
MDLLLKLNTNAVGSLFHQQLDVHGIDVYPPNTNPHSLRIKDTVGPQLSHNE